MNGLSLPIQWTVRARLLPGLEAHQVNTGPTRGSGSPTGPGKLPVWEWQVVFKQVAHNERIDAQVFVLPEK